MESILGSRKTDALAVVTLLSVNDDSGDWSLTNDGTVITSRDTGVRIVYGGLYRVKVEWVDIDKECTRQSLIMSPTATYGAIAAVARSLVTLIRENAS